MPKLQRKEEQEQKNSTACVTHSERMRIFNRERERKRDLHGFFQSQHHPSFGPFFRRPLPLFTLSLFFFPSLTSFLPQIFSSLFFQKIRRGIDRMEAVPTLMINMILSLLSLFLPDSCSPFSTFGSLSSHLSLLDSLVYGG